MAMELVAPAGNMEKLKYALAFGADAVYAGQPRYSLRARDNGFTGIKEVEEAVIYTHEQGKKFYLTSNIFPHNHKIEAFQNSLADFVSLKPDALIMSDPGMIQYVRERFPDQPVHLSVQANCTNWSTAKFWKDHGIERIILSRELKLREIAQIHEQVPDIELEVFAHGAMCIAYSGRCLLSSYFSRRDSNQGVCSNACRYKYKLHEKKRNEGEPEPEYYLSEQGHGSDKYLQIDEDENGTYIMNSMDLCAIENLEKLRQAGVMGFKIEGRTKSVYYVSRTVKCYRGALNDVEAGLDISREHIENIRKLDNRGYFPGFFSDINPRDAQNYETTRVISETAAVCGIIREYDSNSGKAKFSVKRKIKIGDILEVMTPAGDEIIQARGLKNPKGKDVDVLDSGLENCSLEMEKDPGPFALLVKMLK